jgi:lipase
VLDGLHQGVASAKHEVSESVSCVKRTHDLRFVPVRGGDLAVGDWGSEKKDAPVIFAIHGVTASHMAWSLVADALPDFRIVAPDLRGRGRSNALPASYGMANHAEDCAKVMSALAIDRALVVGHSMGAFVAATFAAAHPDRVTDLLLVDGGLPLALPPGVTQEAATTAALGSAFARLSMTFADHHVYREFWRVHPSLVGNWSESVEAYVDYDLVGEEGNYRASTPIEAVARDSSELFANVEYENTLKQIPKRTRLLTAPRGLLNEAPGLYPPAQIAEWKAKLPDLTITEVPDLNHYMIVMGERGAQAVADEARRLYAL